MPQPPKEEALLTNHQSLVSYHWRFHYFRNFFFRNYYFFQNSRFFMKKYFTAKITIFKWASDDWKPEMTHVEISLHSDAFWTMWKELFSWLINYAYVWYCENYAGVPVLLRKSVWRSSFSRDELASRIQFCSTQCSLRKLSSRVQIWFGSTLK